MKEVKNLPVRVLGAHLLEGSGFNEVVPLGKFQLTGLLEVSGQSSDEDCGLDVLDCGALLCHIFWWCVCECEYVWNTLYEFR